MSFSDGGFYIRNLITAIQAISVITLIPFIRAVGVDDDAADRIMYSAYAVVVLMLLSAFVRHAGSGAVAIQGLLLAFSAALCIQILVALGSVRAEPGAVAYEVYLWLVASSWLVLFLLGKKALTTSGGLLFGPKLGKDKMTVDFWLNLGDGNKNEWIP